MFEGVSKKFGGPPSTPSRNHISHISERPYSKKFCLIFSVNTDPLVVKSIEKVRVDFFFSLGTLMERREWTRDKSRVSLEKLR